MELFDYVEVFYNQRRRHSTLGQISPAVFERRAAAAQCSPWGAWWAALQQRTTTGTPPTPVDFLLASAETYSTNP